MIDNTTPLHAGEYNQKINKTIPYYSEFHNQTISVIRNMKYKKMHWLDTGCGTGTLAIRANDEFEKVVFTMADPSEKMIEQAKLNTLNLIADYIVSGSENLTFVNQFDVVTAIQSHHYLQKDERKKATENIFKALKDGGIYVTFENVVPESEATKQIELERWGAYQKDQGKSGEEVAAHIARCGVNYYPITIREHIELLNQVGFKQIHLFWYSYLQAGIYAIK